MTEASFEPCNVSVRIKISVLWTAILFIFAYGAIGEWSYYVLASAIEVALLAAIVYYAWTWPRGSAG